MLATAFLVACRQHVARGLEITLSTLIVFSDGINFFHPLHGPSSTPTVPNSSTRALAHLVILKPA
jgi:hypothetical protein